MVPGLLLLAAWLLLQGNAAAGGSPSTACFDCAWLDELPLDAWTEQQRNESVRCTVEPPLAAASRRRPPPPPCLAVGARSPPPPLPTRSGALPWGQVVSFPPIDYRQLGEELCECVLSTLPDDGERWGWDPQGRVRRWPPTHCAAHLLRPRPQAMPRSQAPALCAPRGRACWPPWLRRSSTDRARLPSHMSVCRRPLPVWRGPAGHRAVPAVDRRQPQPHGRARRRSSSGRRRRRCCAHAGALLAAAAG